jgi:hypothetical protein
MADIEAIARESKALGWWTGKWFKVVLRAGFRCEYCGLDFLSSVNAFWSWSKDHIVPKSQEGTEDMDNLAACCHVCNNLKLKRLPPGQDRTSRIAAATRYLCQRRDETEPKLKRARKLVRNSDAHEDSN